MNYSRSKTTMRRDRALLLAQEAGKLPDAKGRAARAMKNIADRLVGDDVPLFTGIRGIKTGKIL